jgi:thiol-disulfide isomerase/thioredoxin
MIEINGINELDNFILNNNDKIICLYFGAPWCGPCKKLKLKIEDEGNLKEMPLLAICHIDVDNDLNKDIIDIYEVTNLPTQIFIIINKKNHIKIFDKIIGYDWIGFKMMYEKVLNKKK